MTLPKFLFRLLALLSLSLVAVGEIAQHYPWLLPSSWLTAPQQPSSEAHLWQRLWAEITGYSWSSDFALLALGAYYALTLVGYLGMMGFSRLGRSVFVVQLLLQLGQLPFGGASGLSAPEQLALISLGHLSHGALLALAYASPLAALFSQQLPPAIASSVATTSSESVAQPPPAGPPGDSRSAATDDAVPPLPQI
jgi:hypothetical protein